jgi:hypothetical protein
MRTLVRASVVLLAVTASAVAGDAALKVEKLGSVEVRWNSVGYREELMAQLAPGLTWRLGKDGATRVKLEKMALVGPRGGVLLPGEQTLNLRYWSDERWELVVFEEDDWKWSEDKTQLGVFHASVGQEGDLKKHAKALDLVFREKTRGRPTAISTPAITGKDAGLLDIFEVPDDVEYAPENRERWEALPWVELVMRFGPHVGVAGFEPVKTRELHGVVEVEDGGKAKIRFVGLDLPEPQVRSELLETHEGEIPAGVLFRDGGERPAGVVLFVSGGEVPFLYSRTRDGEDVGETLEGERSRARLKKAPRTTFSTLTGSTLVVTVAPYTYTFDVSGL